MIYGKTTVRLLLIVIVSCYRKVDVDLVPQERLSNVISVQRNEENEKNKNLGNLCFSNLISRAILGGAWTNCSTESSNIIYFEATDENWGIRGHY